MKQIFTTTFISVLSIWSFAQTPERIITVSNDTLNVYVTDISEKHVRFKNQDIEDAPILKMPNRRISRLESERVGNHDFTYGNPRLKKQTGLAIGGEFHDYYGPMIGLSMDHFTTFGLRYFGYLGVSDLSIYDLRLGLFYHIDGRYNKSGFSPYAGVVAGIDEIADFLNASAGLMYNFKNGIFLDAHITRRFNLPESAYIFNNREPIIGLRAGYRW